MNTGDFQQEVRAAIEHGVRPRAGQHISISAQDRAIAIVQAGDVRIYGTSASPPDPAPRRGTGRLWRAYVLLVFLGLTVAGLDWDAWRASAGELGLVRLWALIQHSTPQGVLADFGWAVLVGTAATVITHRLRRP